MLEALRARARVVVEVVVEENERTWTRHGVGVRLKLRSPAKIGLDMNACLPDNKTKVALFYKYFKDPISKVSGYCMQNGAHYLRNIPKGY